jgi:hypothetical protein
MMIFLSILYFSFSGVTPVWTLYDIFAGITIGCGVFAGIAAVSFQDILQPAPVSCRDLPADRAAGGNSEPKPFPMKINPFRQTMQNSCANLFFFPPHFLVIWN